MKIRLYLLVENEPLGEFSVQKLHILLLFSTVIQLLLSFYIPLLQIGYYSAKLSIFILQFGELLVISTKNSLKGYEKFSKETF